MTARSPNKDRPVVRDRLVSWRDLEFVLFDLLGCEALTARPRYAEHGRETFMAALETARRMAEDLFAPHNRAADECEPRFENGRVRIIAEVSEALRAFSEAGFMAAAHDAELGGMQLPVTVAQACFALFKSANVGTAAYPFLTIANANLLRTFGTREQKHRYLPHLLSGRFFGTMALTEPQAGSSLADIRTQALPAVDGHYRLSGNKIFISGGDHELSENIIHLVLARLPDAPPGVKGISLFLVPKYRVHPDGSLGARNDVQLAGLIHKMGYRGTTSTLLNFGERGDCYGELVGRPHEGLACMFHMMNEARIGVGMGAVMLAYTGYLHALDYARNRPQGRPPEARDPLAPPVPIIRHADVRRMLLAQKSAVEAGLHLCLYCARLVDEQRTGETEAERSEAGQLLDLLTPVAKSWPSQFCLEANSLAIQVHGGYGYTREYPVEQFYRDNRLNPIHEGTHGIQALDLLGRRVHARNGAAFALLAGRVATTVELARDTAIPDLRAWADDLETAWEDLSATTRQINARRQKDATLALANANVYLEAFGHAVIGWLWLTQAIAAAQGLGCGRPADADFFRGKLAACRYFFAWELPGNRTRHALLRSFDTTCLEMEDAWF